MIYENEVKITRVGGTYSVKIPAEWIRTEKIMFNRNKVIMRIDGNVLKLIVKGTVDNSVEK